MTDNVEIVLRWEGEVERKSRCCFESRGCLNCNGTGKHTVRVKVEVPASEGYDPELIADNYYCKCLCGDVEYTAHSDNKLGARENLKDYLMHRYSKGEDVEGVEEV